MRGRIFKNSGRDGGELDSLLTNSITDAHTSRQRTALKKDFIQACVEDDSIVDETPYHHNLPHKKRGRTREKKIAAKPRHSDCRSLSPFDGNSEVFGSYGSNYRFTRSEDEYAKKVVKHLIDREGDFDYGVLAEVVASRVSTTVVQFCTTTLILNLDYSSPCQELVASIKIWESRFVRRRR